MVYEGEQEGSYIVVLNLISKTIKTIFNDTFPVVNLKSKDKKRHNPYKIIQDWFEKNKIKLKNDLSNGDYQNALHEVKGLNEFVKNKLPSIESKEINFYMEFLLHGIAENSLISKKYTNTSIDFKDLISDIFSGEKELK